MRSPAHSRPPHPTPRPVALQAFPLPLFGGTLVYIAIGILLGFLGRWLHNSKRLTRDESQIYCTTIVSRRPAARQRRWGRGWRRRRASMIFGNWVARGPGLRARHAAGRRRRVSAHLGGPLPSHLPAPSSAPAHPPPPRPPQIVSVFAMWLMWACVWLHQWNPIILPTKADLHGVAIEGLSGGAAHAPAGAGGH